MLIFLPPQLQVINLINLDMNFYVELSSILGLVGLYLISIVIASIVDYTKVKGGEFTYLSSSLVESFKQLDIQNIGFWSFYCYILKVFNLIKYRTLIHY